MNTFKNRLLKGETFTNNQDGQSASYVTMNFKKFISELRIAYNGHEINFKKIFYNDNRSFSFSMLPVVTPDQLKEIEESLKNKKSFLVFFISTDEVWYHKYFVDIHDDGYEDPISEFLYKGKKVIDISHKDYRPRVYCTVKLYPIEMATEDFNDKHFDGELQLKY